MKEQTNDELDKRIIEWLNELINELTIEQTSKQTIKLGTKKDG